VVLAPDARGPLLLVPLHTADETVAVAALDGGGRPLRAESVAAIEEASRSAATALANARAYTRQRTELAAAARQIERLEVLHDLGAALVERATTDALVERLNGLLGGRGVEVEGVAWKSRALARRVGGSDLTQQERALLRGSASSTTLDDGRVAVALRAGGKALGAMRVRREDGAGDTAFLEILATGVAEVADRMSLRAELDDAARGAALAGERDRIATGLHDTAGQLFVAIRLLARREAEQLPPASEAAARLHRLADLAEQGKWEIDHAIDALALFPAARHGLAPALRSLGSSFHSDGDLDVIVDVYGHPLRLPAAAERALYRVVHESLANARQARCSVVRAALTFDAEVVHLEVADDGTGLTRTIPDRGRPGTGDMRRAVAEAGGIFHIRSARPRGVVIEAVIPKDRA
jgi:signal transduction histidine kinase